jgi:hypothetical protein
LAIRPKVLFLVLASPFFHLLSRLFSLIAGGL